MKDSWFVAAVIRMAPRRKTTLAVISAHFRPIFSVTALFVYQLVLQYTQRKVSIIALNVLKKQKMAPKKAPAWKEAVMLLDIFLASEATTLKSLLKLSRAMVVPIKAES
jgi:hypothetical protein